jgi:Tfp pilus assembly protein FimT
MRRRCFTVFELIVVVAIIGILAISVLIRFKSLYEIKLEGVAKKLIFDIRYAQGLAISKGESYGLEFKPDLDRYRLFRVEDNSTVTDPYTKKEFIVDYQINSEYKGIDLVSVNFGNTTTLRFSSLGIPQDGNGNNLVSNGKVTISFKDKERNVFVIKNTGKVE